MQESPPYAITSRADGPPQITGGCARYTVSLGESMSPVEADVLPNPGQHEPLLGKSILGVETGVVIVARTTVLGLSSVTGFGCTGWILIFTVSLISDTVQMCVVFP